MAVDLVLWSLLFILVFLSLVLCFFSDRRYKDIPKVSGRLPFIGNAYNIDMSQSHVTLTDLSKKLGPIFRFKLYREEIVVLNDYETISEALVINGHAVAGRPPMKRTSTADRSSHSIVWQTYTPKLLFLRKEVQKCLKMYGSGLDKLEEHCTPEIHHLLDSIKKTNGCAFDPWLYVYDAVSRVMLNLIVGGSTNPSSASLQKLRQINNLFNSTFGCGSARHIDFLPWSLIFQKSQKDVLHRALKLRDEFWTQDLPSMKGNNEGVINRLLSLVKSGEGDKFDVSVTTAKEVFTNLVLAGTDTTSTTLTCLLLYLLHHPDVQDKLYSEVRHVVGTSRLPSLSDKHQMPYTEAVLLELLRVLAHVPLAIPHYTVCDTTIQGKHVPANTTVYINLWALLHDDKVWEDAWQFRPERFLDEDGQLLPPSHPIRRRMLAFGAGRRVCLGETLAKNRLFLFVTALIQNFKFQTVDGQPLPECDPRTYDMGIVLHPRSFTLSAVPRSHI